MAKQVKYQIPFQSVSGTDYMIDIYAEGYSGRPNVLKAGEKPFVSDEDSSDDFFSPVRKKTGSIQVLDSNGTLMDQLVPKNNTSVPVRLVKVGNGSVEWQGFLSCEAYSQKYTEVSQIIDLNVNSILATADSVDMELRQDIMFNTMLCHIVYAMWLIEQNFGDGSNLLNKIYWPNRYNDMLTTKYLFQNSYFSSREIVNGDSINVDVVADSCLKFLEDICQFLGCVAREEGKDIYIMDYETLGGGTGIYNFANWNDLKKYFITNEIESYITYSASISEIVSMSNIEWRGNDHKQTIRQGAKRVSVSAGLKKFECNIKLPDTPYGSLVESQNIDRFYFNTNEEFYSLMQCQSYNILLTITAPSGTPVFNMKLGSKSQSFPYMQTNYWSGYGSDQASEYRKNYLRMVNGPTYLKGTISDIVGAFFCIWSRDGVYTKGLMIYGASRAYQYGDNQFWPVTNYKDTKLNAVYTQQTALPFAAAKGWLNLEMTGIYRCPDNFEGIDRGSTSEAGEHLRITIALQWGEKWWDAELNDGEGGWSDSFATFTHLMDQDGKSTTNYEEGMDTQTKNGWFFPINEFNVGIVKFYIYPLMHASHLELTGRYGVTELFLTDMNLSYIATDEENKSDRDSNQYTEIAGEGYKDDISYSISLATDASNDIRSSMLWNTATEPTTLVTLDGVDHPIRPEVDLLNRMVDYYKLNRRTLELEVGRQMQAVPIMRLRGFDGKLYTPLAVATDWKMETDTLTCFETPEENDN